MSRMSTILCDRRVCVMICLKVVVETQNVSDSGKAANSSMLSTHSTWMEGHFSHGNNGGIQHSNIPPKGWLSA